jgi:murein DD-endopeptidase MepM/ murein hydrolase activator NlpD
MTTFKVLYNNGTALGDMTELVTNVTVSGDIATAYRTAEISFTNTRNGNTTYMDVDYGKEIRILVDNKEFFRGVIFKTTINEKGDASITAYDYNVYLTKSTDSFKFVNKTATEIIKWLCTRWDITMGQIDDTKYIIPGLILREKTLWDMMVIALTETQKQTGKRFILRNELGKLTLKAVATQLVKFVIEDGRNLLTASRSVSIEDRKTFVKLLANADTKPINSTAYSVASKKAIGIMQHYEVINDPTSQARLNALAQQMLAQLNQNTEEIDVESLGEPEIISGVGILIDNYMTGVNGSYFVSSDSHKFDANGTYTMSLKLSKTLELPQEDYEPPSPSSSSSNGTQISTSGRAVVSDAVRKWEPTVRKYAKLYGIEGYTELLLAIMMQESHGVDPDLMQASAAAGHRVVYAASIAAGVRYFAHVLKLAGGDLYLAIQSYNYGEGFISYAKQLGGYSKQTAKDYSDYMKRKYGYKVYGDPLYVDHVLRYYVNVENSSRSTSNPGGFIKPCAGRLTSGFGGARHHMGIDIAQSGNVPIRAAADGTVSRSYYSASYGECVMIVHNINGVTYETVYAHMRKGSRTVRVGQNVKQGQVIGYMGSTGDSTGQHLHFEIHKGRWNVQKTNAVNPLNYIKI